MARGLNFVLEALRISVKALTRIDCGRGFDGGMPSKKTFGARVCELGGDRAAFGVNRLSDGAPAPRLVRW